VDIKKPDRLLVLTISGTLSDDLMRKLSQATFHFTMIDSRGGPFQEQMTCLMIGFHSNQQTEILELIRNHCRSYRNFIPTQGPLPGELTNLPLMEAQSGGATIHMMTVERFEQI
jgi:uncharacterized protein YaaQ